MATISKGQIQKIYALGAGIGILQSGNENDDLHALVFRLTKKTHISELTETEYNAVTRELIGLMRYGNRTAPLKQRIPSAPSPAAAGAPPRRSWHEAGEGVPGMMTKEQQGKAWRYIYRLMELDEERRENGGEQRAAEDGGATAGNRMLGAIKKILSIDAGLKEPFRWVNQEAGAQLIEQLKRYVRSAERKAANAAGKKKEAG